MDDIEKERADVRRLRTMPYGEAADIIARKTKGRFAFPVSDRINDTTAQGGVRMTIEVGLCKVDAIVHEVGERLNIESRMHLALDAGVDLPMLDFVTVVAAAIPGKDELVEDLFVFQCGRKPVMLVTRPVHAEFSGVEKDLLPVEILKRERAKEEYLPLMRLLSAITVCDVKMVMDGYARVDPSFTKGEIRIYPNSYPPGETSIRDVATLYGVPLDASLVQFVCPGPVPGRGRVAKDSHGTETVQVIGDNIYMLFPVFVLHNEGSVVIFRKAMADAFTLWRKGPPEASEEPEDILDAVTGIEDVILETAQRELVRFASDIERYNTLLADAYAAHAIQIKRVELIKRTIVAPSRERAVTALAAIVANPRVERVEAVDKGLHVITKKAVIGHEGERRACGTYTLRVGESRRISIWTNGPTHPRGIAHPHIDPGSGPCYGNAGQAIIRAAGEGGLDDAVHFALSWLFDGYDDHVAHAKIVEWPKADENGDPLPMSVTSPLPEFIVKEMEQLEEKALKMLSETGVIDIDQLLPVDSVSIVDEDQGSLEMAP